MLKIIYFRIKIMHNREIIIQIFTHALHCNSIERNVYHNRMRNFIDRRNNKFIRKNYDADSLLFIKHELFS